MLFSRSTKPAPRPNWSRALLDDPDGPDFGGFNPMFNADTHKLAADLRGLNYADLNPPAVFHDAREVQAMIALGGGKSR